MSRWKSKVVAAIAISALVGLSGCAEGVSQEILDSPDYQAGHTDGCTTARDQSKGFKARVTRDESIFETNESYSIGWRMGFSACGGRGGNQRAFDDDNWYGDVGRR